MSLEINLPSPQTPPVPAFDASVTLDAVTYTLHFEWRDRDAYWYMRVLDEPGQICLMGDVRLVADWPLYRSRIVRTPPGFLLALDTSGKGLAPGLSDLGARVLQAYITGAEVTAAGVL